MVCFFRTKTSALMIATLVLSWGCGSEDDNDSGGSDPSLPQMSIRCGNNDNASCTSTLNGKEIRAAFFSDECSSFGSSTDILSLGTGKSTCSATDCTTEGEDLIGNWSKANLAAGDYQVYVFIDADGNSVPNGEPYQCQTITIPAESSPHFENFN